MSSTSAQRFRLKQTPIDKWSIREKLALASSVHRSGDQNWYSVSRSLKPFGEPNRPTDWFSQKNCALQYSELLENVETPKRKRGERGENTAQDLIVLELQQKRIEELRELLIKEKQECTVLRDELTLIKSGQAGPEKFQEVWQRIKKEESDKEIAEEEHKKWLVEREAKIAQMKANRHLVLARSPKPSRTPQTVSPNEPSDVKPKVETPAEPEKPSLPELLTVKIEPTSNDVENQPQDVQQQAQQQLSKDQQATQPQTPEKNKVTPPTIGSPSTSPLLTHLLQSPSPSATGTTSYILSPATLKDMQQRTSPSATNVHFFPQNAVTSPVSSRMPMTPSSTSNQSADPALSSLEGNKTPVKETDYQSLACTNNPISSPSAVISSPTLSKLLETSPPTTVDTKETDLDETTEDGEPKELITEETSTDLVKQSDKAETSIELAKDQESVIINQKSAAQLPEKIKEKHETNEETLPTNQETTEVISTDEQSKVIEDTTGSDQITINSNLASEIKQESGEVRVLHDESSVDAEVKIKMENKSESEDTQPATPATTKVAEAPSSTAKKRKRPAPAAIPTPTATRRSGRVRANKDKTSSEEEQASPEGPAGGKKAMLSSPPPILPPPPPSSFSAETSAGEESTDNTSINLLGSSVKGQPSTPATAPTSKASSVTESAPNSPASTALTSEEIENQREYKMWKKSIMLLWRQAATHKFSTLFAHPVTDSEAKGYSTVVYRPIDLLSIRKKIENGQIKTTAEFQRDMMLMFQNAIMYNSVDHDVHQMAVEMQKEILEGIEDFIETQQKTTTTTVETTKHRGRRLNVSTSSTDATHEPESSENRRRKRTSTDTEPGTTPSTKSKTKKKPSN